MFPYSLRKRINTRSYSEEDEEPNNPIIIIDNDHQAKSTSKKQKVDDNSNLSDQQQTQPQPPQYQVDPTSSTTQSIIDNPTVVQKVSQKRKHHKERMPNGSYVYVALTDEEYLPSDDSQSPIPEESEDVFDEQEIQHHNEQISDEEPTGKKRNTDQQPKEQHQAPEPTSTIPESPNIDDDEEIQQQELFQKLAAQPATATFNNLEQQLVQSSITYRMEIMKLLLRSFQDDYHKVEGSSLDVIKRATFTSDEFHNLDSETLKKLRKTLASSAELANEILLERLSTK